MSPAGALILVLPSVVLLQGAMATQNERVGPQKGCRLSHAIHPMQSVPLQVLPIFQPQPFLKMGDEYHLAQGVSS